MPADPAGDALHPAIAPVHETRPSPDVEPPPPCQCQQARPRSARQRYARPVRADVDHPVRRTGNPTVPASARRIGQRSVGPCTAPIHPCLRPGSGRGTGRGCLRFHRCRSVWQQRQRQRQRQGSRRFPTSGGAAARVRSALIAPAARPPSRSFPCAGRVRVPGGLLERAIPARKLRTDRIRGGPPQPTSSHAGLLPCNDRVRSGRCCRAAPATAATGKG